MDDPVRPDGFFVCPAYPLHKVLDPTGPGQFCGRADGYLSTGAGGVNANLRGR